MSSIITSEEPLALCSNEEIDAYRTFPCLLLAKPERIRKRNRIIPRVRVQVDPTRQPNGILGQKPPIQKLLYQPLRE